MENCKTESLLISNVPCSGQEGCLALKNDGLAGFTEGLVDELKTKSPEFITNLINSLAASPCRAKGTIIAIASDVLKSKKQS